MLEALRELATWINSTFGLVVMHENPFIGRPDFFGPVATLTWQSSDPSSYSVGDQAYESDDWRIVMFLDNEIELLTARAAFGKIGSHDFEHVTEVEIIETQRWIPQQDLQLEAFALSAIIKTVRK